MGTRFSLLIVSESEDIARSLASNLSRAGYDPAYTLVADAMELSMVLAEEPWDIVAAVVGTPGLPWEDVTALARSSREDMPVLLIQQHEDADFAREAIVGGASDVIMVDDWRAPACIARILKDSVQRKEIARSWENLRLQEQKHRGMIEHSVLGIFQARPWGDVINANPSFARILGFSSTENIVEELSSASGAYIYTDEERKRLFDDMTQHGQVFNFETQARRKDGAVFWISINARPIRGEAGEIAAVEGTIEDIDDRKKIEGMIIRAKQEWERTFDNVPDIIVILDQNNTIRRCNAALSKRLGVHPRDLVGKHCADIFTMPDAQEPSICKQLEHMSRGGTTEKELSIPVLGGTFLAAISPFFFDGETAQSATGTVLVLHDISQYKQLETQLRQSQKMEAIGTLAGGIAHDFNNILGVIMGYTEMSLDEAEHGTRLHRRLGEVLSAGKRARDLVHQILTFSRQEELDLQPVMLDGVVHDAVKLVRASLPSNISIALDVAETGQTVLANVSQLHQVVMNLCTNASHAMKDQGGTLTVLLTQATLPQDTVAGMSALPHGEYMHLTVQDTGHGIPRAILENIFDPFFTTKKPNEGTGMGLALVHGIVTAHNGMISVTSNEVDGTRFDVMLPIATATVSVSAAQVVELPQGQGRVLVVDDEPALAEVVGEMIERIGYTAVVYSDSGEALHHFLRSPDSFDMLITDQTMPGLTGGELAMSVLKYRPDMPVIICTGFSDQLSPEEARVLGIRDYLLKPVLREDLEKALDKIVKQ